MNTVAQVSASMAASAQAATDAASAGKTDSDAQDRFLKLLVAQMKNQDPLNPLDNAQVTSQLAQISTVNGIEQLNRTLGSLRGDVAGLSGMETIALAGRSVLVTGELLSLAGGTASGGFELGQAADRIDMTIVDASGLTVHQASLGGAQAGLHTYTWDGRTDSGAPATDGSYQVKLRAYAGDKEIAITALSAARVDGVNRGDGVQTLNLGKLGTRTLADVRRVM